MSDRKIRWLRLLELVVIELPLAILGLFVWCLAAGFALGCGWRLAKWIAGVRS
jgi:hypothetical protein